MLKFPSRFRRLDEILADLPIEDPMLLSELDGYLTAVVLCPEPLLAAEWLPPIWGGDFGEAAPFEDPIDVRLFGEMVRARHAEIVRELGRGKPQPLFDVDERNGEILWDAWIDGFETAMALRPDSWATADADPEVAAASSYLRMLADIAADDTPLTSVEINAISDEAARRIPENIALLYRRTAVAPPVAQAPAARPGRNDACPCGSGKKYKRCCALA